METIESLRAQLLARETLLEKKMSESDKYYRELTNLKKFVYEPDYVAETYGGDI